MRIKKDKKYPKSVFKYCNLNSNNHTDNFFKNQIWLSNPLNLNDPYDCSITYDSEKIQNIISFNNVQEILKDFSEEEMSTSIKENILSSDNPIQNLLDWVEEFIEGSVEAEYIFRDLIKDIQDMKAFILKDFNEKYRNKLKISSFSENHKSLLMWGHYANNHQGFCIEYDLSSMNDNENLKKYLFPVKYSNERFDITDFYIDNVINKEAKDTNRLIHSVLYNSEDWEYEKEWRFVITESEYDSKTVSTPKPKAIYLGSQIKEEHKEQFIKVCKENDIDVYQMKLDDKIYKVNTEKI
ncbi:DUF2971 domain-containing protein [Arcobacter peruensis]|uniref:DUF2971 domain-containing protein n=1 Tax=Arcobacter peruensis TaxID=2320140 RepID=UPI000F080858|nr:DUF2971 domain-containing protein [Arcobacter peruensis]